MKQKIIAILICVVVIVLGAVFAVYQINADKTIFNNSYVNGNSAGNLYNNGLFCENGGQIFFANPSDAFKLYSMNTDGSDLKKLSNDIPTHINADSHYVYYVCNNPRTTGDGNFSFLSISNDTLCRINREDGKNVVILDDVPCLYAALVGDYVYYMHYDKDDATSLYRVKIDSSEQEQVSQIPYYTCGVDGQFIYYNGIEGDHNIWRLNTANNSAGTVYTGNCWMPISTENGNVIYFLDCDDNYKLARVNLSTGVKETLCDDRIDSYNVSGNYIYFQRNGDDAAFCRMMTDGSDYRVIANGNFKDINITSRYVYCRDFASDIVFRTPIDAPIALETFSPGIDE